MEKAMVRLCLECGKPLKKAKRIDSKFCDGECRNDYCNALKYQESAEIKKIQNTLKSNRRILKNLLGNNREVIMEKAILIKLGFNFDYHTHHVISKTKRNEFIFSFNYGYHQMDNNKYKIVKSFT